jgi:ArsR family transcriptional regulator, lead/cadmium/zinc/bismuth-responsive transcriptional repressor
MVAAWKGYNVAMTQSFNPKPATHGEPADSCEHRGIHRDAVQRARAQMASAGVYTELAALFGALSDPTRAAIVHLLLHQELCTCDLGAALGVTDSAVSQHLRLLRALRLVKSRRHGKFVYHMLDDAHVALILQLGLTHHDHRDVSQSALGPTFEPGSTI